MEHTVDTSAKKRQIMLRDITKHIMTRRMMLNKMEKESPFATKPHPSPQTFQNELQHKVNRDRFSTGLIGLVQKKEQMYKAEMGRLQHHVFPTMQCLLEAYTKEFGLAQPTKECDDAEPAPKESIMENAVEADEYTVKPSLEDVKLAVDMETK